MTPQLIQDETPPLSLQDQLRAATRQKHHALNTQITARLSLCLPPAANSPLAYASGLLVFGQIYFAFESALATSLASSNEDRRVRELCERIYLPQLVRTSRIREDIAIMKSRLRENEADGLESLAEEAKTFFRQVYASLAVRPHVVLAYTWAMYLALFNGGRWIRKQLAAAGSDFWQDDVLPLSFWEFEDEGQFAFKEEQLKLVFKDKFGTAAAGLTADEKRGIVEEANRLFDLCSEMVEFLDSKVTRKSSSAQRSPAVIQAQSRISFNAVAETLRSCVTSALTLLKTPSGTPSGDEFESPG